MKKILLILLLTIPFVGFGQNGIQKEYYENGNLKGEVNFKDGKQEGIGKLYYEDNN